MSGSQDDIPPPPPPPPSPSQTPTQQTPHTVSTIKLHILKKGEYDIWAMKMEHYLAHTDYPIWEVLLPRTAEEIVARERERKARTTLLMALPEDHLAKFHKMTDAKEIRASQCYGLFQKSSESIRVSWSRSITGMQTKIPIDLYLLPGSQVSFYYEHQTGSGQSQFDDLYNISKSLWNQGNQDNRRRDDWGGTLEIRFGSRTGKKEDSKALVIVDGEGVDWTSHSEEDKDYALMACNSSESDTEKLLAEAQRKEDLKAKVEKWHNSSKNLSKLLNTQMSANDKFGLGYGDHRYDGILSYENEVLQSVFMNKESELEKQPLYDRFVTAGGMHVVPPPMTGNYMPSGPDIEVDYSQFTYGPKQTQPSESESQSSEFDTCESNISTEPSELVSEPVVNEYNVECQLKIWSDALIIEEYKSDSEDEYVSIPIKQPETPSFANQQVKTPRETVKNLKLTRKSWVNTARTSGTKNVSTARQSFNRQAVLTSTAMKVKPIVNRNGVRPANVFHKTHSPTSRPFKRTTVLITKFSNQKVYTAKVKEVSTLGGTWDTAVKPSAGNKAYLADFQDFNGGPVAFGGSKGYITGKGKIKTGFRSSQGNQTLKG
ncbi:hypothetical protein Tco_0144238 [Tanacetum coccineum]